MRPSHLLASVALSAFATASFDAAADEPRAAAPVAPAEAPAQAPASGRLVIAVPPEDACAPGCPHARRGRWEKRWTPTQVDTGVGGLRMSTTSLDGSDHDTNGAMLGLQFGGQEQSYAAMGIFDHRSASFAHIGGGRAGFEGGLGIDFAGGLRTAPTDGSAGFLRLGARGWLMGNNYLYSSLLEVPQIQLGWQWLQRGKVVELAGRTGPVLVGRYNTGDDAFRRLGDAFEVGGHAAMHFEPAHLEAAYTRVYATSPGGAVDMVQGSVCGQAFVLAICVDGRYFRGDQRLGGSPGSFGPAEAFYGGLTIGIGKGVFPRPPYQFGDPAPQANASR